MPQSKTQQQPTPEQMQSVATAGATAAATAPEGQAQPAAAEAMRSEADRVGFDLTDEQIDRLAEAVSSKNIAALESRGAFDAPPEPVKPPEPPAAPPAPGEQPAAAETPPQPPVKRTFAHRFMGVD